MPWPATHILVADKIFDRYFGHLDRKAFMLGTCFPDIRYPAKIDRTLTHIKHIPLSDIRKQSAFRAGLLFHSFVDGVWNTYIRQHRDGLFAVVPHNRPMFHAMKALQDRFLYPLYDDWGRISAYFKTILPEERTFGASDEMVQRWHAMQASYLSKSPCVEDLEMLSLSLPADLVDEIRGYYQCYLDQPLLIDLMTSFYTEAGRLISQYRPDSQPPVR